MIVILTSYPKQLFISARWFIIKAILAYEVNL